MPKITGHSILQSLVGSVTLSKYLPVIFPFPWIINSGGNIEAVEICLQNGGSIDDQQDDLSTPVHLAASQGSVELLQLMFTCQSHLKDKVIRMTDIQGMTPLHK